MFDAKTDQKNDQNRNSQWIPLIKNQHRIYFQSSLLLLISESPWHKVERRCWTTWTIIENMQILFRSTRRSKFVLRQDVAGYWKVCQLWWGLPQFFDFRIYTIVPRLVKKLSSEPGCRMEISVETNYPIVRNGCSKLSGVFRDVRGAAKCYRYW